MKLYVEKIHRQFYGGSKQKNGKKGDGFRNMMHANVSADGETLRYLHATKGWRKRRATPQLLAQLGLGT